MLQGDAISLIADQPEVFLALSLSAPAAEDNTREIEKKQFTVELSGGEFVVRSPIPLGRRSLGTQMLCTKETIAAALLLHRLWMRRSSPEEFRHVAVGSLSFERDLKQHVTEFARSQAVSSVLNPRYLVVPGRGQAKAVEGPGAVGLGEEGTSLWDRLDVGPSDFEELERDCDRVFRTLEERRWAIDPGFMVAPELMVLLGLIPMKFSVRTPEGERVYREIRIAAPLWSLDIDRVREGRQRHSNWRFNLRGIRFIRNVLKTLAEEYVSSEEDARQAKGLATLPAPTNIVLDRPDGPKRNDD